MSLETTSSVDAVGIENESGFAVLTIMDSWDWSDERNHLLALQAKINAYFQFIEGGQIWISYPAAIGRTIVIEVVCRFPLPNSATKLLHSANNVAADLDVAVRHRMA